MNQILDKNYTSRSKITVEFSNEIAEIPYIETKKFKSKKDNYKIQFFISSIIATLGCFIFLVNLIKSHSQEKISKKGLTEAEKLCIMILVVRTTALHIAGWSSLAARRAHNPKVVGSNPTPATIWRHSSAGQSIRFIPEVSCVRITLPLPENPVKMIA